MTSPVIRRWSADLQAQEEYRKANGLGDIPTGECEGFCCSTTTDREGVCKRCRSFGWMPGDVNR